MEAFQCPNCVMKFKDQGLLSKHMQRFCGTKLKDTAAEVIDGYSKKKAGGIPVGADEIMLFLKNGGDVTGDSVDGTNLNLLREDVAREERELDKLMKGLLNKKDVNSHNAKGEIAEKKEFLAKKKFDLERELIEMSKRIEQKRMNELQARVFKERALGAIDGVDRNMLMQLEKQKQSELADIDAERTRLAEQEAEAMREIDALERRIRGGASTEESGGVLQRAAKLSEQQMLAFKHGKKAAEYSVHIENLTEKKEELVKDTGHRTRAETPQDQVLQRIKHSHGDATSKLQRMKAEHKAMLDEEARDARHFFEEMEKMRPEGARLPPKTLEGYKDIAEFAQEVEQEVEMSGKAWQDMQDDIEGLVEYRKEQLENDAVRNAMIRSAPERGNASQNGLRESLDDIDMIRSQRPTAATAVTPPLSDRMVRPSPRAGQRLSPEISGYGGMGGSQYMGSPHYAAAGLSTSQAILGGGSGSLEEVRRLREEYISGGGRDPVILTSLDELERDARHNMAAVPPPVPPDPYANPALAMMQRQLQHSNEILAKLAEDNERLQTEIEESASGTKVKHQFDEQQKQLKKAMNLVQKHLGGDAEREEARLREEEEEIMETMNFDMSGLEDDEELQQLHMEHVREMTKMRFEIQKFKQLSRLEKLKQDLDRERLLEQKKLDNELWQTEQQRRLQDARVRQLLGKEGGVTSITANDGVYKPQTGFALFFDYVIGLPKRVKECCLVYQFFFKAEAKTPVKALDICETEDEDPSHSLVVLSQERRFTKVAAIPNLKVICVIQEVVTPAQGPSQGPKMQALGWALLDLFSQDRKLKSGLWRLPTFRPPVNPSKAMGEMEDMGRLPSMELFLRLVHADNVASHQQMKIDPTYTKGEYKIPQEYGGAAAIPVRPRQPIDNAPMTIEDAGPSKKKEAPPSKDKAPKKMSSSQDTVGVSISKAKDVTTDKPLVLKLRLFHGNGVVSDADGSPMEYTTRPGTSGRGPISVLTWNEKATFKFQPESNDPSYLTVEVMEEQADGNFSMQAWFYTQLKGLENGGKIRPMTTTLKPLWKGPYITLPEKPRKTSAWNKKMSLGITIYDPQEAIIKAEREKRKTDPREAAADSVEGVPEDLFYSKKAEAPDDKLGVDESVNFYIDGARFLPENIILSSVQLSIYDARWTLVGAMEEKECDSDHFTMSPVYEMRKGFRGRLDDPSLCALVQVNGLDMYERRVVLVGFAIINLFVKEGTTDAASSSDEYCLNSGAFQIPLKRGTPNPKINLKSDALDPCDNVGVASLLIRIEKYGEGRQAQVDRPEYQTRIYDTSRCHPTQVEKQMYSRLQNTRDQAVRDVLAGMDKSGKLAGLPKDQLQKFIKSKMKTDGEVPWMNFNYMIKYDREAGLQIAVDGAQNTPQQLLWTVVSIVPPNNFYSKENLTDDVRFTQLNDLKADVKAPRWLDGFWKFHPNVKSESCAIFDVRTMADSNDSTSDDSDDEDGGKKKKNKSKGAATKSVGWGVLPVFSNGGHVLAGSYQIPLFDGAVNQDYIKDGLQYGSIPQVVSAAFDKKKLKSKNNMSLFVRLVDRQRTYEYTEAFTKPTLKKPANDKFLKFKPANKTLEKQAGKIGRSKVSKINPQQWIDEQAREFASALNLKMMY